MHITSRVAALALLATLTAAGHGPAAAADNPPDRVAAASAAADRIAADVNRVAPPSQGRGRVSVDKEGKEFRADADTLTARIPSTSSGAVELSRRGQAGHRLRVGLPAKSATADGVVAQDGTVTYQGVLAETDLAVQSFDDGVRVQTVLRGAGAPTEFSYPVAVPPGGRLAQTSDGSVAVLDADGVARGGFDVPWAKDRAGRDVPTTYVIRGHAVVQTVQHAGASYPVVADPWLGISLISSASWTYRSGLGWTLMVSPTGWARAQAGGYLPGAAGWDELYAKYRYRGLNTNLGGMRDQYICHQQFAAFKSTWNLDEWRPDVSYASTVAAACNP